TRAGDARGRDGSPADAPPGEPRTAAPVEPRLADAPRGPGRARRRDGGMRPDMGEGFRHSGAMAEALTPVRRFKGGECYTSRANFSEADDRARKRSIQGGTGRPRSARCGAVPP